MAIYHFSEKNITRSDGRSAVACAAYRAGQKLQDQVYGKTQDYTKKEGVEYSHIYAPDHTNEKLLDREILWNSVEQAEFKKNGEIKLSARLAKEYEVALPHELTINQQIDLIDDFCQKIVKKHDVILDASIHAPHDDNLNCHAHIMFTTRKVNQQGLLGAKAREFNDQGPQLLKEWRETFAEITNHHLAEAGLDTRIDHRSYKDQGRDYLEPTIHEGNEITALRRQGIDTEISLKNDVTLARNQELVEVEQFFKGLDQEIMLRPSTEYLSNLKKLEQQLQQAEQEEREILAELARLDNFEREQKENEQVAEIDRAYNDFIELQKQYALFASRFDQLSASTTYKLETIDQNIKKTEKWIIRHPEEAASYRSDKPDFYTLPRDVDRKKKEVLEKFKVSVTTLADEFDIDQAILRLRESAKLLQAHNIDLPITKPTMVEKLTGKYVHSFDNLKNFDREMKPIIDQHRQSIKAEQREFESQFLKDLRREKRLERESGEGIRPTEKLEKTAELHEPKKVVEEKIWVNEASPTPPERKENDNDFSI